MTDADCVTFISEEETELIWRPNAHTAHITCISFNNVCIISYLNLNILITIESKILHILETKVKNLTKMSSLKSTMDLMQESFTVYHFITNSTLETCCWLFNYLFSIGDSFSPTGWRRADSLI